jgi:hypothetical protein
VWQTLGQQHEEVVVHLDIPQVIAFGKYLERRTILQVPSAYNLGHRMFSAVGHRAPCSASHCSYLLVVSISSTRTFVCCTALQS